MSKRLRALCSNDAINYLLKGELCKPKGELCKRKGELCKHDSCRVFVLSLVIVVSYTVFSSDLSCHCKCILAHRHVGSVLDRLALFCSELLELPTVGFASLAKAAGFESASGHIGASHLATGATPARVARVSAAAAGGAAACPDALISPAAAADAPAAPAPAAFASVLRDWLAVAGADDLAPPPPFCACDLLLLLLLLGRTRAAPAAGVLALLLLLTASLGSLAVEAQARLALGCDFFFFLLLLLAVMAVLLALVLLKVGELITFTCCTVLVLCWAPANDKSEPPLAARSGSE